MNELERPEVVTIPSRALEALEAARVKLYELLKPQLADGYFKIALLQITGIIFEVANRKYWFKQEGPQDSNFNDWVPWGEATMQECLKSEGFIARFSDGTESEVLSPYPQMLGKTITHCFICKPSPLKSIIERWLITGQPVWIKYNLENSEGNFLGTVCYVTNNPDWRIKGAIYSLSELSR